MDREESGTITGGTATDVVHERKELEGGEEREVNKQEREDARQSYM